MQPPGHPSTLLRAVALLVAGGVLLLVAGAGVLHVLLPDGSEIADRTVAAERKEHTQAAGQSAGGHAPALAPAREPSATEAAAPPSATAIPGTQPDRADGPPAQRPVDPKTALPPEEAPAAHDTAPVEPPTTRNLVPERRRDETSRRPDARVASWRRGIRKRIERACAEWIKQKRVVAIAARPSGKPSVSVEYFMLKQCVEKLNLSDVPRGTHRVTVRPQ